MAKVVENKSQEVIINAPIDVVRGHYANTVRVVVTDSETIIDFAFVSPEGENEKHGEMVSRIIVNTDFAQKIAESITTTLGTHKDKRNNK